MVMNGFRFSPSVKRELALLAAWLVVAGMFGMLFFSSLLPGVLLALTGYVSWSLYNLNRLCLWLDKPGRNVPEAYGVWDEIYYQLYHLYKRQRSARKKLTSILNRFQKSTQALPYATIVLNQHNEIEWFNPAAGNMFNLKTAVDIGQPLDNLLRQPVFSRYLSGKNYDEPVEFTLNQRKILVTITPYGNGQFLVSARDVTSRSQLDEMRRDFISNVSHELKTPLTVVSGYIECLAESAQGESAASLEKVRKQLQRMNDIVTDLLELARLESSERPDDDETVDLARLLEDLLDEIRGIDDGRHHIIDQTGLSQAAALPVLHGSYKELRMALLNLLVNAIRYSPGRSTITVSVENQETALIVSVADQGAGIDYEHIPRLTERFYRIDAGRSRDQGGTGLGLAIVKHVLDRHNAYLRIQSQIGKGSVFSCVFPKKVDAES